MEKCSTVVSPAEREESKNPAQLQRTTQFHLGLFFDRRGQDNQHQLTPTILSLRKIRERVEHFEPTRSRLECLPATKNHQGGLRDSEDESDAKIFFVPDSEIGQQSASHIQLELMPSQPQQAQGNDDRVLVENNFDRDNCPMVINVFRSIFYNWNVQVHNYNSSRWLKLERFLNLLTKVEYPSSGTRRSLNYS